MLNHKGTQKLITNRLTLRRFCLQDAEAMFNNYAADPRVTRFLTWVPYENVEGIRSFLSAVIKEYECSHSYHWAIEFEGDVIGSISAIRMDDKNNSCEIGYCIGFGYWNKGVTSEALRAVLQFLFTEVGMHRITAKHDVENPASGEVMKKCGMVCEGRLRKHYYRHDNTYSDAVIYGILKYEFESSAISCPHII